MRDIILVAHNLRSTHNVGSLLRTADGLGVKKIYLTGYTPYPMQVNDSRLPHLATKISRQISKTALGAEDTVQHQHLDNVTDLIKELKSQDYQVIALEQTSSSQSLPKFHPNDKLAIIVGREVEGLEKAVLDNCDLSLEIPMLGQKESFNVVQAAAIAVYHCQYSPFA